MTRELEDALLERLHEATMRGLVRWHTDREDANRDAWTAECAGESLRVELIYAPRANGSSYERIAVEVLVFGHLFTAAVGSSRYDRAMDMISFSMPGWREASHASEKKLKAAITKLDSLLKAP